MEAAITHLYATVRCLIWTELRSAKRLAEAFMIAVALKLEDPVWARKLRTPTPGVKELYIALRRLQLIFPPELEFAVLRELVRIPNAELIAKIDDLFARSFFGKTLSHTAICVLSCRAAYRVACNVSEERGTLFLLGVLNAFRAERFEFFHGFLRSPARRSPYWRTRHVDRRALPSDRGDPSASPDSQLQSGDEHVPGRSTGSLRSRSGSLRSSVRGSVSDRALANRARGDE
ncbi:hypothetical protein QKG26_gp053 [Chelonid alphaherpesvirus 5]|uniref:Uncharacterized protein n=1 Tax=Chelonid alphaherpesvirus 5 TaxID=702736 RepID=V5NWW6_9ALPH|nr:hypothetical protein QKG26_gp053 [Chelonid alphaherpesvirus 5]AHA93340.1 hypothetical protein [Chelonid alphaherpesvirus 5]